MSGDESCVASFVDYLLSVYIEQQSWEEVRSSILFTLEPSDYAEPLPLRTTISERVDKVLAVVCVERISFITPMLLNNWQVSLAELEATASRNQGCGARCCKAGAHVTLMACGSASWVRSC